VRLHTAAELPHVKKTSITQTPLVYIDTVGTGFEERWNDLLESRENEGEAKLAVQLLHELHDSGIPARHIAIITPYVAQARLLRAMLKDRHYEVDSIDGFQGREKEAIIISLVRSNEQGEIGFLDDTRRMNVALTRARRLLIVLGDSGTISRHHFYDEFLKYVDENKAHRSAWEWIKT
jgi:superfamily I DNA and/or RNA helicase